MSTIASHSPLNISETVIVIQAWFQRTTNIKMAYGESNGHVTDDATWPRKFKLVTPIRLEPNISKTEIDCCEAVRSAIQATVWLLVTSSVSSLQDMPIRAIVNWTYFTPGQGLNWAGARSLSYDLGSTSTTCSTSKQGSYLVPICWWFIDWDWHCLYFIAWRIVQGSS